MHKTRVAVLRGGPSNEYEVSLKTGASMLKNLDEERYIPIDVFIDRKRVWHTRGIPRNPGAILENADVVLNTLHGEYGEDGTVQKILEHYRVPYTGSGVSASALCMNKLLTKEALRPYCEELGLRFAKHAVVSPDTALEIELEKIYDSLSLPIVVKPVAGGSSVGVEIASNYDELFSAVGKALKHSPDALLEEHVAGREATCGVIDRFRGGKTYALLPIEIVPKDGHTFFDYEAKYGGASEEICPGNFRTDESEHLQSLACRIHEILGLRHYSRSDFVVTPRGIYFLEVNTLPGLTEASLIPKALSAVGCRLSEFVDHLVNIALEDSGRGNGGLRG